MSDMPEIPDRRTIEARMRGEDDRKTFYLTAVRSLLLEKLMPIVRLILADGDTTVEAFGPFERASTLMRLTVATRRELSAVVNDGSRYTFEGDGEAFINLAYSRLLGLSALALAVYVAPEPGEDVGDAPVPEEWIGTRTDYNDGMIDAALETVEWLRRLPPRPSANGSAKAEEEGDDA